MHRRALLVAVAGLSGCTGLVSNPLGGGSDPSDGSADPGSDGSATDAPTTSTDDSPAATATPDATTPDEVPPAAELRRMDVDELLALAREQIDRAVDVYAGDGGSLSAVTAASEFDPAPVVERLYGARAAYEEADRQGISTGHRETIKRLRRVEGLLRLTIDVQVLLVEVHVDLEELVTAITYVDPETAESLVSRTESRHRRTRDLVAELSRSRYEQSVGVVERLSRDEYDDKHRQFDAETDVLGDLIAALPRVLEGVRLFDRAHGQRQSGAPYSAADLARDAETAFARGTNALDNVASDIPSAGRGFASVASDLLAATEERRREAREFHEEIG